MVSTDTIWTILGVLLVQMLLGGSFAAGYIVGRKKRLHKAPANAPKADERPEDAEARRKMQENIQKALNNVMSYDVNTAIKRRVQNG